MLQAFPAARQKQPLHHIRRHRNVSRGTELLHYSYLFVKSASKVRSGKR